MATQAEVPEADDAVVYRRGTTEWELKNGLLPYPAVRTDRQDAHFQHPPSPKDRWLETLRVLKTRREPLFQYTELKDGEIRILSLQPGQDDRLSAKLFKRKLEDVRKCYEALSYTWGSPKERPHHEILIQDLDAKLPSKSLHLAAKLVTNNISGRGFPIRKNLYQALMMLRQSDEPVNIWVDAICIDQSERGHREKAQQLAKMAKIYNYASNVCIWLGDGFDGAQQAFQLVTDIMNFKKFDVMARDSLQKEKWASFIEIMKAPWFSRRWVIQEVALSRNATVHCGTQVVHWDDFSAAVSLLLERIDTMRNQFKDEIFEDVETTSASILVQTLSNVCHKADDGDILGKLLDLETLVSTLLCFYATSPRDTIYSVLSLANDPPTKEESWMQLHREQLVVNYGIDSTKPAALQDEEVSITLEPNYQLSTRDVFIAFVTRSIERSKSLDIICRHWAPPVFDEDFQQRVPMPSWISNISKAPFGALRPSTGRQNGENLVAYQPHDQRKRYNACGSYAAEVSMSIDSTLNPQLFSTDLRSETPRYSTAKGPNVLKPIVPPKPPKLEATETLSPVSPLTPSIGHMLSNSTTATNGNANGHGDAVQASPATSPMANSFPNSTSATSNAYIPTEQQWMANNSPIKTGASRFRHSISQSRPRANSIRQNLSDGERKHQLSGIMNVFGIEIGTIQEVSDVMRGGIIPGDWIARLGWDADKKQNRVSDKVWRLLVADRTPSGEKPPLWYQRACLHGLVDPRVSDNEGNVHSVTPPDRKISEMTTQYFHRVETVVWNRRLFEATPSQPSPPTPPNPNESQTSEVNQSPHFGFAPKESDVGDVVCVLFGCTVPVILRHVKDQPDHYQLIGEAYVHGIMHGEAVLNELQVNKMKTVFKLC